VTQTLDRASVVVAGAGGSGGSPGADPVLVGIVAAGELLADPASVEPCTADSLVVAASSGADRAGQTGPGRRAGRGGPTGRDGRGSRSGHSAGERRPVRLTRRGRMVVLAALVVLAGAIAALAALPSQAADPAAPAHIVVVRPGDSLWSIVERYHPGADPVRAVDELIRVNHLPGTTIYAGEELTLPSKW
jgi:LysM domain